MQGCSNAVASISIS